MTAIDRNRSRAAEEAANWRLRLDAESASESDWLAFEAWLAADTAHRAAYDALDQGLIDIELNRDAVAALADTAASRGAAILPFKLRPATFRAAWVSAAAIAAGLAIAVLVAPHPATQIAYAAPADHDRVVELADGSVAHLNRNAAIQVTFGDGLRRVELERGEAAFSVVHDASKPFEVRVGGDSIRDIGTEFNVARNAQSLVVTVRSGAVEIAPAHAGAETVRAGYQARLERGGPILVSPAMPDDAFAWQSGRLVYHNAPLAQVIEDLNRYSDKPIVADSESVAHLRFSGVLMVDEPGAMLARLQNFLPIQAKADAGRILVKGDD